MKKKIGKIVFAIVILAFLLIQVYPIIWLFMASVKPTIELSTTPFALPKVVTFENFIKVFSDGKIGIYMWNSLKVTGIYTDSDYCSQFDSRLCIVKIQNNVKKTNL